jgi:hypothetical protein
VLLVKPSVNANYWTSFFPAFVVLGFGMAVSVAPLTTVVMGSVGQNRVGTASGVNNAVARVAGVLAIAVLGIVMVTGFSHALQQALESLRLPPNIVQEIKSNTARLGGIKVPSNLDPQTTMMIRRAVDKAFIFGFRIIMLICAALAVGSSAIAWRMIPSRGDERVTGAGGVAVPSEA